MREVFCPRKRPDARSIERRVVAVVTMNVRFDVIRRFLLYAPAYIRFELF